MLLFAKVIIPDLQHKTLVQEVFLITAFTISFTIMAPSVFLLSFTFLYLVVRLNFVSEEEAGFV